MCIKLVTYWDKYAHVIYTYCVCLCTAVRITTCTLLYQVYWISSCPRAPHVLPKLPTLHKGAEWASSNVCQNSEHRDTDIWRHSKHVSVMWPPPYQNQRGAERTMCLWVCHKIQQKLKFILQFDSYIVAFCSLSVSIDRLALSSSPYGPDAPRPYGPLCPHNLISAQNSPVPLPKFQMTPRFKLLKPTGHMMHHQFNIQQLYALSTLYLCVSYLSQKKQRLVPLTA